MAAASWRIVNVPVADWVVSATATHRGPLSSHSWTGRPRRAGTALPVNVTRRPVPTLAAALTDTVGRGTLRTNVGEVAAPAVRVRSATAR